MRGHRGVVRLPACRPITSCSKDSCRGAKARVPSASSALRREQRTIVFYEAVHRVAETLAALLRRVRRRTAARRSRASSRRRTSRSTTGTLAELAERLGSSIPLLGEFVIVVAGAAAAPPDETEARRVYALLAAELPPDKALKLTAAVTGVSRNVLYRLTRT